MSSSYSKTITNLRHRERGLGSWCLTLPYPWTSFVLMRASRAQSIQSSVPWWVYIPRSSVPWWVSILRSSVPWWVLPYEPVFHGGCNPTKQGSIMSIYPEKQRSVVGVYPTKQNSIMGVYLTKQCSMVGFYPTKHRAMVSVYHTKQLSIMGVCREKQCSIVGVWGEAQECTSVFAVCLFVCFVYAQSTNKGVN